MPARRAVRPIVGGLAWPRSGRHRIAQLLVAAVLEILVETPALDLIHHLLELRARDRLIDEALAAPELAEVPGVMVLEFRRDRELPQRQIFFEVRVHCLLGTSARR